MIVGLNDIIDLGDGINRLVISKVFYKDNDYILLIDETEEKKVCMIGNDTFLEVNINLIDPELMNLLISIMNFNLDFNFDNRGMLKK